MSSSQYFKTANYSDAAQGTVANITDKAFHSIKELITSKAFPPIVLLARTTIIGLMEKLVRGQLRVITKEGIYTFGTPRIYGGKGSENERMDGGDPEEEVRAEIVVVNEAFWVRMLLLSDLGFAEAFMIGDIEVDNLDALFKLFILNRKSLGELSTGITGKLFSSLTSLASTRFVNSISNAISNISAHYDISNLMFEAFLSKDMTYSCALFGAEEGGPEGDLLVAQSALLHKAKKDNVDLLERAQMRKLRRIIENAKLSKGDRVLEIGSGWGSLAIEAVRSTGCTVDTLTLSVEQKLLAEARIAEAGLTSSITVHLLDYRSLPASFTHAFDRVISIEMIEAVGQEFLDTYFKVVEGCLKLDRGICVIQVITMPESRFESYGKSVDFIQKHIFPGGFLPSVTCLVDSITKGGEGRLVVEGIENIGPHYARTLREWRKRFEVNFETEIVPALREAYPELDGRKGVEVFRRKWIYYFQYCATGFAMRALGDHILTLTREGNLSLN